MSAVFESMQLREVVQDAGVSYLAVDIQAAGRSIPCRFHVDPATAKELLRVLSFRPFPERAGEGHTYWHQGSLIDPESGSTQYRVKVCSGSLSRSFYVRCSDNFLRAIRWIQEVDELDDLAALRHPA